MDIINATHFLGGTITYKVLNTSGSIVSIVLTQTYIYDYTKITCTNTMIVNQTPKLTFNSPYRENMDKVNCTQYCNQSGGYIPPSVVSYCTDYSIALGITVGQRSDIINITNGSYFLAAYQSTSWRQLTLPSTSGSLNTTWSISCLINLQMRSDGTYNNPPAATIISPIFIPVGIPQSIFIPTIDADNDNVRCRFANGTNECGSACPPSSLPNGTVLFSNCTMIITGAKVDDWYAIAIQVSDSACKNVKLIERGESSVETPWIQWNNVEKCYLDRRFPQCFIDSSFKQCCSTIFS